MNIPCKSISAPVVAGGEDETFDLTIRFGGKFVHFPIASYHGGAALEIKHMSAAYMCNEELQSLCASNGLGPIKGFYDLRDGGFLFVLQTNHFCALWVDTLMHRGKSLTLYADCIEFPDYINDEGYERPPSSQVLNGTQSQVEGAVNLDGVRAEDWIYDDDGNEEEEQGSEDEEIGSYESGDSETGSDESDDGSDENDNEDQNNLDSKCKAIGKNVKANRTCLGNSKESGAAVNRDVYIDPEYDFSGEFENLERNKKLDKGKAKFAQETEEEEEEGEGDDEYMGDEAQHELENMVQIGREEGTRQNEDEIDINREDLDWSSCESVGSDEEGTVSKKVKNVPTGKHAEKFVHCKTFKEVDVYSPEFSLGTVFTSKKLLREAVHSHALNTRKSLKIKPNDSKRIHVKCRGVRHGQKCGFKVHLGVLPQDKNSFMVNAYYPKHICPRKRKITNIKSSWIAKKYLRNFMIDPRRKVSVIKTDIRINLGLTVSRQQVTRARKMALDYLYGTEEEQFAQMWDYKKEVEDKNPGSSFYIELDPLGGGKFFRCYVCLVACKEGFKSCRPIIGVDGCHLKTKYGGILLTAVGIDANNNIFPIAWAVVRTEDYESWDWFLATLETDLSLQEHENWTFMSDKQKGLLKAFSKNFNESINRFCVRHLHGNMKKAGFTGVALKQALWNMAISTTVAQFEANRLEMAKLDPKAVDWIDARDAKSWSRAFFSEDVPKCDIVLNNGCETFNSCILDGRELGIISMLDWIMEYTMVRFKKNRDLCNERWRGTVCPKIQGILDVNETASDNIVPLASDTFLFKTMGSNSERYSVDLNKMTCGCRKWNISGIPCKHAIACISENEWEVHQYVNEAYHVSTYKRIYQHAIVPINGRSEWIKTGIEAPLPPCEPRTKGRPSTLRRRDSDEPALKRKRKCRGGGPPKVSIHNDFKLKKNQTTVKCSYCGEGFHNIRSCETKKKHDLEKGITQDKGANKKTEKHVAGKTKPGSKAVQKSIKKTNDGEGTTNEVSRLLNPGLAQIMQRFTKAMEQGEGSSGAPKSAPTMWEQMKVQGSTENYTKNLIIDGAHVHMTQKPSNTISMAKLDALRAAKKKKKH